MTFDNLNNDENRITYEKESDDYAGDDITVLQYLIQLKFKVNGPEELNGKNLEATFKSGQDFEYVKYKIASLLDVDQESIVTL